MKPKIYFIVITLLFFHKQCLFASNIKHANTLQKTENHQSVSAATKDSTTRNELEIIPESDNLFTTHYTCFFGGNVLIDYPVSTKLQLGLGFEFSHCKLHYDNGWALHNVNFRPIYIDSKLNVLQTKNITLFAHLSTGVSFASYTKESPGPVSVIFNVSEQGIYLFTGVGYSFRIYKYFQPVMEVGFKGFHMSLNQLDVNPHGLTLRIGFIIETKV